MSGLGLISREGRLVQVSSFDRSLLGFTWSKLREKVKFEGVAFVFRLSLVREGFWSCVRGLMIFLLSWRRYSRELSDMLNGIKIVQSKLIRPGFLIREFLVL